MAEVRKRGPEFWDEFEFYLSDLVVGCVLDVVLVSLMAPVAPLSAPRPPNKSGASRRGQNLCCAECLAAHTISRWLPSRSVGCVVHV